VRLLTSSAPSNIMESCEGISTRMLSNDTRTIQPKSRHNKTPKFTNRHQFYLSGGNLGRLHRKADAVVESHDEASLAQFTNADLPTPNAMLKENGNSGILYSFDKEGKSPNEDGREIGLDALVDRAEEKWESRRMDRIVREYEVLNEEGETVRLSATRKRARGGPRQEAVVDEAEISGLENDDECFEVI
jgi:hypothetical protein